MPQPIRMWLLIIPPASINHLLSALTNDLEETPKQETAQFQLLYQRCVNFSSVLDFS